jgi:hypothetical protein
MYKLLLLLVITVLASCSGVRHAGAPYYNTGHRYTTPVKPYSRTAPSRKLWLHRYYMRQCDTFTYKAKQP